jgi:hypothetical protein
MGSTGKPRHVGADLGNDRRRSDRPGRRHGEQQLDGSLVLVEEGGDAHLHTLDRLFQRGDVVEQFADE